jgi:hypothetical protein
MSMSPFFQELRAAYEAELEDLRTDSEGKDVLRKRLAEKRSEIDFLLKMLELSPEMVAVVLHQAFKFTKPAVLEHLVSCDADDLLEWDNVVEAIQIAPWAQSLVDQILQEPRGHWFMTIAAGMEYMASRPAGAAVAGSSAEDDDEVGDENRDDNRADREDSSHTEDAEDDEAAARTREEAGNDWLEQQGFDRKE